MPDECSRILIWLVSAALLCCLACPGVEGGEICSTNSSCLDCLFASADCGYNVDLHQCLNRTAQLSSPPPPPPSSLSSSSSSFYETSSFHLRRLWSPKRQDHTMGGEILSSPRQCRGELSGEGQDGCPWGPLLPFVLHSCSTSNQLATLVILASFVLLLVFLSVVITLQRRLWCVVDIKQSLMNDTGGAQSPPLNGCSHCAAFIFAEDPILIRAGRTCVFCSRLVLWAQFLWLAPLCFVIELLLWFVGLSPLVFVVFVLMFVPLLLAFLIVFSRCYSQIMRQRRSEQRVGAEMMEISHPTPLQRGSSRGWVAHDPDDDSIPLSSDSSSLSPSSSSSSSSSSSTRHSHYDSHHDHDHRESYHFDTLFNHEVVAMVVNERIEWEDEPARCSSMLVLLKEAGKALALVVIIQLVMLAVFLIMGYLQWDFIGNVPGADYGYSPATEFYVTWLVILYVWTLLILAFKVLGQPSSITLRRAMVTNYRTVLIYRLFFAFDISKSIWHTDVSRLVVLEASANGQGEGWWQDLLSWHPDHGAAGFAIIGQPPLPQQAPLLDQILDGRALRAVELFASNVNSPPQSAVVAGFPHLPDLARLVAGFRSERSVPEAGRHPNYKPSPPWKQYLLTAAKFFLAAALTALAVFVLVFIPTLPAVVLFDIFCCLGWAAFFLISARQYKLRLLSDSVSLFSTDCHHQFSSPYEDEESHNHGLDSDPSRYAQQQQQLQEEEEDHYHHPQHQASYSEPDYQQPRESAYSEPDHQPPYSDSDRQPLDSDPDPEHHDQLYSDPEQ